MKEQFKVKVIIEVDYDSETVGDPEVLADNLEHNLTNAIGNGLLTGPDHEALVDNWKTKVEFTAPLA